MKHSRDFFGCALKQESVRRDDETQRVLDKYGLRIRAGYARVLAGDLVLGSLGNMTALEALEAGVAPKDVWLAVCETQDIPEVRRLGPDREPRR